MFKLAILFQVFAVVFVILGLSGLGVPETTTLIVGGTYDYLINNPGHVYYSQMEVLEVRGDYVRFKEYYFDRTTTAREDFCTIGEFERYSMLRQTKTNPFEKAETKQP